MLQIASIQRFFISMIMERLFEIWRTHSEGQITLHNAHTRWYFAATSKGDIPKNKQISWSVSDTWQLYIGEPLLSSMLVVALCQN